MNDEAPIGEKILQFWLRVNTFLNTPADQRSKTWWVEAEAIVRALYMHRLTRDPKYLPKFATTYDIAKHQADWENGEWYATHHHAQR